MNRSGGRGQVHAGDEARRQVTDAGRRRAGRSLLSAMHRDFDRVSPQTGVLDREAFERLTRDDPDAALSLLVDLSGATDAALRSRARLLAARVAVRHARAGIAGRRGVRRMASVRGADGDVDLERTLDGAGTMAALRPEDVVARAWTAPPRAVCLLVDRSGSMQGRQVMIAATAAAALVLAAAGRADAAVIAFSRDALVLQRLGERRPVEALVGDVLSLRGSGTTDLALALRGAAGQLALAPAGADRVALLLSDGLATAGSDPLVAAAGIDRLHVLGTSPDPDAVAAGRALAARGGGHYRPAQSLDALAPAITALLS